MAERLFKHNDLRFYVRAFFDLSMANGRQPVDIRYMVPGFEDVDQATAETIEGILEEEDEQNAEHMKQHWLHYDRALMAVGMRESSGYETGQEFGEVVTDREKNKKKKVVKNAYIGLARTNAEHAKDHLGNVPLGFEVTANNPQVDKAAIASWNRWRDEVLNSNNFSKQKKLFIGDGYDFGSGIIYNPYRERKTGADTMFFEERARQGQPIEWEEYQQYEEYLKSHVFEHVDTFSVIRDRRAKGEASMSFKNPCHTITTWLENITVTEARQRWPHLADRIQPNISDLFNRINPGSLEKHQDDLMVTVKNSWIQMPVSYPFTFNVHVGGGNTVPRTTMRNRVAVVRVERLEGIGVADMYIDEYAHGQIPLTMWQRRPSKYHSYGIGAYKDMWSAEWAYNIAFNGKFRWFDRLAKGGGFYFKGVLGKEHIDERTKEHAWVSIDPNSLPADMRERSIKDLVMDTPSQPMPSVYDNLEISMEDKVNRTSGTTGMLGEPVGNSGRQQLLLRNQSEAGLGPTVANLEDPFLEMGEKFFSNSVQFDAGRPIRFMHSDPVTGEKQLAELNVPEGEIDTFDIHTGEWKMLAYHIKNDISKLDYKVQISTRSLIPSNPTERRFFWQDTLQMVQPLTQSLQDVLFLEEYDKHVFGGLLHDMVERLKQVHTQNMESGQQQLQREQQLDQREKDRAFELDMLDKEQNQFRLEAKAQADLIKALAAFKDGDTRLLHQFLNRHQQAFTNPQLL